MNNKSTIFFIVTFIFKLASAANIMNVTTGGGNAIQPGRSIRVTCSIDKTSSNGIEWLRKSGDIVLVIGESDHLVKEIADVTRYTLHNSGGASSLYSYTLEIKDAKPEDTASIGCRSYGDPLTKAKFTAIAVCEDPKSASCKCMLEQEKWASPQCFEEPPDFKVVHQRLKQTVIGLAVCLALAIICALVLALFVGRDCVVMVHRKQKEQIEKLKQAAEGHGRRAEDHERLQTSVDDPELDRSMQAYQDQDPRSDPFRNYRDSPMQEKPTAHSGNYTGYPAPKSRDQSPNPYRADLHNTSGSNQHHTDVHNTSTDRLDKPVRPDRPRQKGRRAVHTNPAFQGDDHHDAGSRPSPRTNEEVHNNALDRIEKDSGYKDDTDSERSGYNGARPKNKPAYNNNKHSRMDSDPYEMDINQYPPQTQANYDKHYPHSNNPYTNGDDLPSYESVSTPPYTISNKLKAPHSAMAGHAMLNTKADVELKPREAQSERQDRGKYLQDGAHRGRSGYTEPRKLEFIGENKQSGQYISNSDTHV